MVRHSPMFRTPFHTISFVDSFFSFLFENAQNALLSKILVRRCILSVILRNRINDHLTLYTSVTLTFVPFWSSDPIHFCNIDLVPFWLTFYYTRSFSNIKKRCRAMGCFSSHPFDKNFWGVNSRVENSSPRWKCKPCNTVLYMILKKKVLTPHSPYPQFCNIREASLYQMFLGICILSFILYCNKLSSNNIYFRCMRLVISL